MILNSVPLMSKKMTIKIMLDIRRLGNGLRYVMRENRSFFFIMGWKFYKGRRSQQGACFSLFRVGQDYVAATNEMSLFRPMTREIAELPFVSTSLLYTVESHEDIIAK